MGQQQPPSTTSRSSSPTPSVWRPLSSFLFFLVLVQWGLILTAVLDYDGHGHGYATAAGTAAGTTLTTSTLTATTTTSSSMRRAADSTNDSESRTMIFESQVNNIVVSAKESEKNSNNNGNAGTIDGGGVDGVAVTVMLHAPKWFHRRYMVMIQNVLVNLPPSWKLQVFYNEPWLSKDVLPYHPGLQRLLQKQQQMNDDEKTNTSTNNRNRIIWTPIPNNVLYPDPKKPRNLIKPKVLLKSIWFWESVVAENVLTFSGNGVVCGNHHSSGNDDVASVPKPSNNSSSAYHLLNRLTGYDYVGTPWGRHDGRGGNGETHSFRHRSAMIRILQMFDPLKLNEMDMPDYLYFTQHMMKSIDDHPNRVGTPPPQSFRVADKNTTMLFGGVHVLEDTSDKARFVVTPVPFVVSGTQGSLQWSHREALLNVCPELKLIFPSLHEPACFGAHPDGEKCKSTICALRDNIPGAGC